MIESFPYISNKTSKILIVGTMPSKESLKKREYYAHQDNHFWDIIFRSLDINYDPFRLAQESKTYAEKVNILLKNDIALWDVLSFCERVGNLDKAITNEIKNDFKTFFKNHNKVKKILFNGKKSYEYFIGAFDGLISAYNIEIKIMNSTSPSNTKNVFRILKEWQKELTGNVS